MLNDLSVIHAEDFNNGLPSILGAVGLVNVKEDKIAIGPASDNTPVPFGILVQESGNH